MKRNKEKNFHYFKDIINYNLLKVKVAQSCLTLCDIMDYKSMEFSRPEYWSGEPFPSPGDLPNSGTEHRSPALQVDSLSAEPPEKPKNTGMGRLSLLQLDQIIILFLAF